jgi:CheY-like chemotaxis protein
VGGEIAVETQLGHGTIFRVALPPAPTVAEEVVKSRPIPDGVDGRRGRLLVVDDELAVGNAIRRLLQGEHDVTVLTSAREARDRNARGERFDVILCDLMMPLMTGMELHAELTTSAPEQAMRMVLLTGGAFTANARRFLEECGNPRLDKPVDGGELRGLVRKLVGSRAAAGEREAAA